MVRVVEDVAAMVFSTNDGPDGEERINYSWRVVRTNPSWAYNRFLEECQDRADAWLVLSGIRARTKRARRVAIFKKARAMRVPGIGVMKLVDFITPD